MILYLENNTLPEDDQSARTLVLHRDQYSVVEGVLYHLASDKTLRVVVPESDRIKLVQQSHGGKFGGHLGDAKVYGMLCKHYWWPRMHKDVANSIHVALDCVRVCPAEEIRSCPGRPALTLRPQAQQRTWFHRPSGLDTSGQDPHAGQGCPDARRGRCRTLCNLIGLCLSV